MVDKESCLLTSQPVNSETQSILLRPKFLILYPIASDQVPYSISLYHSLMWQSIVRFIIHLVHLCHCFYYRLSYLFTMVVHTHRVRLYHSRIRIHIHNQSRQKITLTMYQTIGIILLRHQSQTLSHTIGCGYACFPKVLRQFPYSKLQYTHSYRTYLIMAYTQCLSFTIHHFHYLTLLWLSMWIIGIKLYTANSSREHPWVKTQK